MEKIKPEQWYSAIQAGYSLGFSRPTVIRYINEKALKAIVVNNDGSVGSKRYAIKGEWIESFRERYESGTIKDEKYSVLELKSNLERVMEYCKEHKIKTLKELITSINLLK